MLCAGGVVEKSGQVQVGDLLQAVDNVPVTMATLDFQNATGIPHGSTMTMPTIR